MAEQRDSESVWLPIIGKALCYMCMHAAQIENKTVLQKVKFLENLGLSRAQAAQVAGSSAASVSELRRRANKRKPSRGKAKSKGRR